MNNNKDLKAKNNKLNKIKKIVGVMSGKGGVGKSLVTSLLAVETSRKGYKTAIMDTDITGPSIPKIFGLNRNAKSNENGLLPEITENGLSIMSINLLLNDKESPVIWRGPLISNTVKQFWTDVIWGEIDCMYLDLPPGTGDVPLTLFQSLPVDGIVIVVSPQDLVHLIVKKSINMAKSLNIPVLGIIENMSYLECPDCGKQIKLFGESKTEKIASELGISFLGQIPMRHEYSELCDRGEIEKIDDEFLIKKLDIILK
jgi:Mrp family chromosome partitioning ATPase